MESFCAYCGIGFEEMDGEAAIIARQRRVQKIMGKNFFGVEEVAKYFGIQLTKEELSKIAEIPFSDKTLQECKDTHILFLGINRDKEGKPLTIHRFKEMFPENGQPKFYSYQGSWYDKEEFANKETPELRWYLMRKSILEESRSKTYEQQEKLLKENEERERAIVYVYEMLLMFKATGERLFKDDDCVWCKDIDVAGFHVYIGEFGLEDFSVGYWWGDDGWDNMGLAPARKFD
ncbi:MAG: hypothetical protein IB617_01080 [Candidatus Nealsonbacteria bacterium]|nr:MAG: hypothetical protein IB617_01080 [Candidatus Nealsonbacteria bacterium]